MKPGPGGKHAANNNLRDARIVDESPDLSARLIQLYKEARPALLNYVRQMVRSEPEAEDIVQSAFLKTYDQASGQRIDNVQAWLYRVAHNLAIDAMRRRVFHEQAVAEWVHSKDRDVAPSAEDASISRQIIARALDSLNERERACLLLRADGFSYSEIGEILEISAKSVSVYLVRATKKVRSQND
jgi:RNA polymerase sigma-70 factor, ECF subfamily